MALTSTGARLFDRRHHCEQAGIEPREGSRNPTAPAELPRLPPRTGPQAPPRASPHSLPHDRDAISTSRASSPWQKPRCIRSPQNSAFPRRILLFHAASRCASLFRLTNRATTRVALQVFSLFSPCSAGAPPISVQRGVSPRTARDQCVRFVKVGEIRHTGTSRNTKTRAGARASERGQYVLAPQAVEYIREPATSRSGRRSITTIARRARTPREPLTAPRSRSAATARCRRDAPRRMSSRGSGATTRC